MSNTLIDYQITQKLHDYNYHKDIVDLSINRRMTHITLHLMKYLGYFVNFGIHTTDTQFIDSFIMLVSASNVLGISLYEIELIDTNNTKFIQIFTTAIAKLAKACEAADHGENYPIQEVWRENIILLFSLIVNNCELANIIKLAKNRLLDVECKINKRNK